MNILSRPTLDRVWPRLLSFIFLSRAYFLAESVGPTQEDKAKRKNCQAAMAEDIYYFHFDLHESIMLWTTNLVYVPKITLHLSFIFRTPTNFLQNFWGPATFFFSCHWSCGPVEFHNSFAQLLRGIGYFLTCNISC